MKVIRWRRELLAIFLTSSLVIVYMALLTLPWDAHAADLRCTLRASDTSIDEGDAVTLRWTSDNAEEGRITPRIGELDEDDLESGYEDVRLSSDTAFIARFENDDGDEVECRVTVNVDEDNDSGGNADGLLFCTPSQQTAAGSQPVIFTANGGNGQYLWIGASGVLQNSSSRELRTSFLQAGGPHIYLKSGTQQALCVINSAGSSGLPGFPNTGRGDSDFPLLSFVVGLTAVASMSALAWHAWRLIKDY